MVVRSTSRICPRFLVIVKRRRSRPEKQDMAMWAASRLHLRFSMMEIADVRLSAIIEPSKTFRPEDQSLLTY